jgi:ribosomal protein S18 acetylase RimI-like enzyme
LLVKALQPAQLDKYRAALLRFIGMYGDRRITGKAIRWLQQVSSEQMGKPGNLIVVALENGQWIGIGCAAEHGAHTSFIVIHPRYRGRSVGASLIRELSDRLGEFTCTVAADNMASLKMCFNAGLHAVDVFEGPTGKATLKFNHPRKLLHG